MSAPAAIEPVIWHDLECGAYAADLALWRALADEAPPGPVLDVGAGTGRVTVELARAGREVVALDLDPLVLDALARRMVDLPVATVCADARAFRLDRAFPLCVVPMQTIQLLGGAAARRAFLAGAREHVEPGGLLAIALADALEGYGEAGQGTPLPDVLEVEGTVYSSRPVAVHDLGDRVAIERLRETVSADGERSLHRNLVELDRLDGPELAREGVAAGFTVLASRRVPATEDYVSSEVVVLRG